MPISSMIVKTLPDRVDEVVQSINAIEGASVTHVEGAHIVTLTDTADKAEDKKIWSALEELPGVTKVDLIYHNFEDVEDSSE